MNVFAAAMLLAQVAPPERSEHRDWLNEIVPPYLVDLFTPLEHRHGSQVFHYRLFQPVVEPGKKYPILVWTSGYGEFGYNNFAQLRHLHFIFEDPGSRQRRPFYCLVMQVPEEFGHWFGRSGEPTTDEPAAVLMEILENTISNFPIDEDRVYLAGVSEGGLGCWELAMRYPDRFAAVAPLGSPGAENNRERLGRITHVPIWTFHSESDPFAPIERVRETVETLKDVGGVVHLTEVPSQYHDCWTAAFREHHLLEWLMAQRRGSYCWSTPGRPPWDCKFVVAQLGIPALLVAAIVLEWKRRRNVSS